MIKTSMIKTIVVHIDGGPQQASRVAAAAQLAAEHGAHLIGSAETGISWLNYAALTGCMGAPAPDPASDFGGLREAGNARLQAFREAATRLGVASWEARLIEDDTRYALLLQARYADLVVLSQDQFDVSGDAASAASATSAAASLAGRQRRLPENVALRGGRPVLVVPADHAGAPIPGTVVAGWDGSLQALRAITAALPLLRRADSVKLTLVNPDALSELHGEQPGADMALYLARHDVKVEVVLERTRTTAGHALTALAHDCGAGLMVAGAYGHSRYREWVLGGATRELLERAPVPLLIAH
jgi:nucleotide-binding universal stress UspA family protein